MPNALAVTTAIIFVLCRILVGFFPDAFFTIAWSWFHGIEVNKLGAWNMDVPSFILGLVSATITAWIIGYIFSKIYRLVAK